MEKGVSIRVNSKLLMQPTMSEKIHNCDNFANIWSFSRFQRIKPVCIFCILNISGLIKKRVQCLGTKSPG